MNLDLKEMLVGTPTRLRYVIRFSTCHKVHPENVAEHSYYVALYSMWLYDWCDTNHMMPLASRSYEHLVTLLRGALLHDLEEAVSGDVNRIFKYSDPSIAKALHCGARKAFMQMMQRLFPDRIADYGNEMTAYWDDCKNDTHYIGRILRFADFLSVLSYMMQELTNANITMREHWQTMYAYLGEFQVAEYAFLRPLVNQANDLMHEAFSALPHVPGETPLEAK